MSKLAPDEFETVEYRVVDRVALITLSRALRHNAIDARMSSELPAVWQHFKHDRGAVVAILTGAGEKAFCTGADIGGLPDLDMSSPSAAKASMCWTSLQNDVWKPVICAVNGMAIGGGLHFVADSDIVLAADNATFSDTHVNVGLVSGLESVGLARRMPIEAVLRMALVGGRERMDAERALQCGLVGEVVPKEVLLDRAFELAGMLAANSPSAMARTKRAIWTSMQHSLDESLLKAWKQIIEHSSSADVDEGRRAFLERRDPIWEPYDMD